MSTQPQKTYYRQTELKIMDSLLTAILALVLVLLSIPATASENIELNALFKPDKSLINAEARGRVTIYDGLHYEDVEKAMDEQFERIEHMMFIRINYTQADGNIVIDDEC